MAWENGCTVIVMLSPLVEDGVKQCDRYWPDEGSSLYHIYEVSLPVDKYFQRTTLEFTAVSHLQSQGVEFWALKKVINPLGNLGILIHLSEGGKLRVKCSL